MHFNLYKKQCRSFLDLSDFRMTWPKTPIFANQLLGFVRGSLTQWHRVQSQRVTIDSESMNTLKIISSNVLRG